MPDLPTASTALLELPPLVGWHGGLAPGHARTGRGELVLGGVRAERLARRYGTPLLVIDTDVLDATVAEFLRLGAELGIDVAYAAKALLFVELARRLRDRPPLTLDLSSLGELITAEAAEVPSERLHLHGAGKLDAELEAAIDGRVGRIVVDSVDELARLVALGYGERSAEIVLRFNTGIEAHTHEFVRTGGENSKFGIPLAALDTALAAVRRHPRLRLVGLHSHVGSQIFEPAPFLANLAALSDLRARTHATGFALRDLIVGGGFGVPPDPATPPLDIAALLARVAASAARLAAEARIPAPRLGIEPGRALIAAAGTSLYRVIAVKQQGARRYAVVDGSLADNPRPALYGAYHHPVAASRAGDRVAETAITIAGRSCENDELVRDAMLPADLRAGDLIALCTTGAYTYSMASNYNRFSRPAVVFAGRGRSRLVVRRERFADVLRNDVARRRER